MKILSQEILDSGKFMQPVLNKHELVGYICLNKLKYDHHIEISNYENLYQETETLI